jgi:hypothetical protein
MGGCGSRHPTGESLHSQPSVLSLHSQPTAPHAAARLEAPARIDGLSAFDPMEVSVGMDEQTERR